MIELHFHDPPKQRVWSAEGVPRCAQCGHSHVDNPCTVLLLPPDAGWRNLSRAKKCGCTAHKKQRPRAA